MTGTTGKRSPGKLVAVTGANGFVGSRLVGTLEDAGFAVRRLVRDGRGDGELTTVGNINGQTEWRPHLKNVDCIVHAAALAHVVRGQTRGIVEQYRAVNVEGTRRLAEQAAEIGVRRMIFMSSIGVHGNTTDNRPPFSVRDVPRPVEHYAVSKLDAELLLRQIDQRTALEVVILRPPLIYGPRAPGNIERIVALLQKGWPLPLASIRNQRSLLALDNLVDLIIRCIDHSSAAGKTFLAADGEDLSTPELFRRVATAHALDAKLFPFPASLLRLGGRLSGKSREIGRLTGSLQVDCEETHRVLGWIPAISLDEGFRRMSESSG